MRHLSLEPVKTFHPDEIPDIRLWQIIVVIFEGPVVVDVLKIVHQNDEYFLWSITGGEIFGGYLTVEHAMRDNPDFIFVYAEYDTELRDHIREYLNRMIV